jgi:predicted Fe-Mo cluster-binding NifX family protein
VKIVIPEFGSRVSPRFDCAQVFLVVTTDDADGIQRQELAATNWTPSERIKRLVEWGVNTVICAGIDWWSAESLRSAGIMVYKSITGNVDEALAALLRGDICAGGSTHTHATMGPSPAGDGDRATVGELDKTRRR